MQKQKYFLFYKSFLKEVGKQQAKIITAEQLTQIEENIKQDFRTKIEDYKSKIGEQLTIKVENLKSELAKNNISYQISLAELTKMRFVKIEELVVDLIKLQNFIRENMFWAENDEDFRNNKKKFNKLFKMREEKFERFCPFCPVFYWTKQRNLLAYNKVFVATPLYPDIYQIALSIDFSWSYLFQLGHECRRCLSSLPFRESRINPSILFQM